MSQAGNASQGESSETINARRTESLDAPGIHELSQRWTEEVFGRVDIVNSIEKAILAVTLCNDDNDILGHGAFFDYPNLPDVDPALWEGWLKEVFEADKMTALNTLFVHYFTARPEYSHGCSSEIVSTVFNAMPEVHFLLLFVPFGVFPDSSLASVFQPLPKKEGKASKLGEIFVCHRYNHVPVLHIRTARVEDHDDLTPIFDKHSNMLNQTYGDFFLAELIEAQDETCHALVAEVEGTAIGFMSISEEVNYDLLNECFELRPFHGLKESHEDDDLEAHVEPSSTPVASIRGSAPPSRQRSVSQGSAISSRGSRASGRASASKPGSAEPVPIQSKLADAELGASQASLLSEKSAVSHKSLVEGDVPDSPSSSKSSSRSSTPRQPPEATGPHDLAAQPQFGAPAETQRFVPTYCGRGNAFCIQLFCVDDKFEMRSMDFLPTAFEMFPDRDFCVITVPHMVPEFPLLQNFVRATPRILSTLPHELYIFHRDGLVRNLKVRPACSADTPDVEKLVKTLDLQDNFLADLKLYNQARRDQTIDRDFYKIDEKRGDKYLDGTAIQVFVADVMGQVVGCAIIRQEEDIEYIRSHYNVENFIYYTHHRRKEHAHMHHFALNPIFHHYTRPFIKEILRLGKKTCLYYPVYPPYVSPEVVDRHSLITCLPAMVPVPARRQIVYPAEALGENAPSKRVLQVKEPYSLNHVNRKLVMEPKVIINARIVVVGASDTGLSFLETLTFSPHLRFNNLTLISPNGLPGDMPPDNLITNSISDSRCYTHDEYAQVALRTRVNVVFGKMTNVDRSRKYVVVNGSTKVYYDHLVLATGQQYQIPCPTGADISHLATNNELPKSPESRFTGLQPTNVFVENDAIDASYTLFWVEQELMNTDGMLVVYGNTLDSFTCVQTLLKMGVAGSRVVLVMPPYKPNSPTCFNNTDVNTAVMTALKAAGVEVYWGYYLAQWNDGEWRDGDPVTSACFTSNAKPLKLECEAMFCFYRKAIDYEAFKAMSDACLVFDGRLVIDAEFHTNDAAVRAAGPLTKFQRKYHADHWTHSCFNSKEVGMQLASAMLSLFDPTVEVETEDMEEKLNLIPMYRSPKISEALLPGGFHYLLVTKPGLNVPIDQQMAQADFGRELVTGSPDGRTGYFRLHINQYNSIESVTCLSTTPFETSNLICLFGFHERYLNNIVSRFDEGLIPDFFAFFRQEWAMALFHDRFQDFRDEIRELLISRPMEDVPALEEKVRQLIEEDLNIKEEDRQALLKEFVDTQTKRVVETRLLEFLSYNRYHLPMFAKPGMV